MAGMMVAPSLEARHDEEYSAEAGRQSLRQLRIQKSSSQLLQSSAVSVTRITSPTNKTFETEECWLFGEFISTNYGNADAHDLPKIQKRRCQIVQYRQHSSSESLCGSSEVAKPIKIDRPAKPRLITIPKSTSCLAVPCGKSEADAFAQSIPASKKLPSAFSCLNLSPHTERPPGSGDDSGCAGQGSYNSTGDTSRLSLSDPPVDSSSGLLRRISFKKQIPRWIQKNSPLHKSGSTASRNKDTTHKRALKTASWSAGYALDHLETLLMQTPLPVLDLSSPVITSMRSTSEKALLTPFKEIFPGAPIEKLSSLCAVFVAQIYLASLEACQNNTNGNQTIIGSVVDGISGKARARLGLPPSKTSQVRVQERPSHPRYANIHDRLNEIADALLVDLCGTSDSGLKRALMSLVQLFESNKKLGLM
ncbi:conserved hypothetical protein [Histoplasma capsulatum G186AR]|uniref:Uncharacterized protein n=2 Tax=Ajellomyces capsulatus TaxID=5037 RepID=C0NXP8_AJECG|nr:uncharacterized protein HCBG_07692 [Histoplasma capsulatum G186AR]EEH03566.1 conserved hypothetical protein [Histoplasma capsulatum G186AR]KAG5293863.1 hypothetical protein I7I52_05327 [Histoplasma capsulatum]QSS75315.1 hypothetical protein I7I50_04419 [Histoplasma capsulatum G186AR]